MIEPTAAYQSSAEQPHQPISEPAVGATGSTSPRAADPQPLPNGAGTTSVSVSSTSTAAKSESSAENKRMPLFGIDDVIRVGKTKFGYFNSTFEVEKGSESSLTEVVELARRRRMVGYATPVPTREASYGTTEGLFIRLQNAIIQQAHLSDQTSALVTFWTMSTWFSDALYLAPGLVITGPPLEGDLVLRTLSNFCRWSMLLARADLSSLKKVNWDQIPTLLFNDPNLTKASSSLLGCLTRRGYIADHTDRLEYADFYGPKAIYVGEEVSPDRTPRCCLQVHLSHTAASLTQKASKEINAVTQQLQNQLLSYRLKNFTRVHNSEFNSGLTSDTGAIANTLGACIVDSPALQAKVISLLAPFENQRKTDCSTSITGVTVEAILHQCHAAKARVLVGEITTEVNSIMKTRGERLTYSAEKIGHEMKRIGLVTRRLGSAGKGLVLDQTTIAKVHELSATYGGAGLDRDERNLHCSYCAHNNGDMQVM